jgi:hypothetical protein
MIYLYRFSAKVNPTQSRLLKVDNPVAPSRTQSNPIAVKAVLTTGQRRLPADLSNLIPIKPSEFTQLFPVRLTIVTTDLYPRPYAVVRSFHYQSTSSRLGMRPKGVDQNEDYKLYLKTVHF